MFRLLYLLIREAFKKKIYIGVESYAPFAYEGPGTDRTEEKARQVPVLVAAGRMEDPGDVAVVVAEFVFLHNKRSSTVGSEHIDFSSLGWFQFSSASRKVNVSKE